MCKVLCPCYRSRADGGPETHAGGVARSDKHLCTLNMGCCTSPGQAFSKALGCQKRVAGKAVPGGGGLCKGKLVGRSLWGLRSEGRESSELRAQGHPVNFRAVLFRMPPLQKKRTPTLLQIKRDSTVLAE